MARCTRAIFTAAPDAICDELDCFRVVATLEPLGTACLAAVVVAQIALYCHVIVTPRVAMGRKRRSLLRASLLLAPLLFEPPSSLLTSLTVAS